MEEQRRSGSTRFQKGVSGNPAGRKKGVPNKISRKTLAAIAERGDRLLAVLLEKAEAGDMAALKLCIERLCPPQKEIPLPAVKLPEIETPADLPKATGAILKAAASGALTPGEVAALSAAVRVHVDALQTSDIARRLLALQEGGVQDED